MLFPHPMEIRARQRRMVVTAAVLVLIVGFVGYLIWPKGSFYQDYSYQGQSLESSLRDFANPLRHAGHLPIQYLSREMGARMEGARKAVKAAGTNAIPTLLEYVQAEGASTQTDHPPMPPGSDWPPTAREKHAMAEFGFSVLKKDALPAKPALITLTKDKDAGVRMCAVHSLFFLVEPDYKELATLLVPFGHDPDPGNRKDAAETMRIFIAIITPEEAEKVGVFEAFPELRSSTTSLPR